MAGFLWPHTISVSRGILLYKLTYACVPHGKPRIDVGRAGICLRYR
jgi:hypothetical protein